jgi:hypothetical protein
MIRECLVVLMMCGTLTAEAGDRIAADVHDSGLAISHDSYNAISRASDGRIYYVLSTESLDTGAQMYVYDPATRKIQHIGDLTEACGEKGLKAIPQGKSHVNFVDAGGKLYFATHVGYYSIEDGMETMGKPPAGYKPYPGGHFLSYDVKTGRYENLALAPNGEGIITMNMDTRRGRLYGITWPTGLFVRYDLKTKSLRNLGGIANQGESVQGANYQTICRSLSIDPRDGSVYFTNSTGTIFRYRYDRDAIEPVAGDNLRKDYFGLYDPASPGHMGYNWRQTVWSEADAAIYGVHGNSGYLFRFDPRAERVEVLDRITSRASKASGMFDQFSYGYLGFTLAPDGHTLHYLTGGPIYENGHRVAGKESTAKGEAKGMEDLHLVTYDLKTGTYRDTGAVFLPDGSRPTYVNSIAVGNDGTVYTLARITVDGKTRGDLLSFPGPLKAAQR